MTFEIMDSILSLFVLFMIFESNECVSLCFCCYESFFAICGIKNIISLKLNDSQVQIIRETSRTRNFLIFPSYAICRRKLIRGKKNTWISLKTQISVSIFNIDTTEKMKPEVQAGNSLGLKFLWRRSDSIADSVWSSQRSYACTGTDDLFLLFHHSKQD